MINNEVRSGPFFDCDPRDAVHIFWTLGNGVDQTEAAPLRRAPRRKALAQAFDDAISVLLRGLTTVEPAA